MIPPEWVCRELERVDRRVRLGWAGRDHGPDELNCGTFMLLELLPVRKDAHTFRSPWRDRGPVYGSHYDRLTQAPYMVYDVSPEDVFSGRVVALLRRWLTPIRDRTTKRNEAAAKEYRSTIRDMATEIGGDMYRKGQRDWDSGAPIVAKKFATQSDKDKLTGDWPRPDDKPVPVSPMAVL
jgi:hypothetical protein